jgi:hypothetical protein
MATLPPESMASRPAPAADAAMAFAARWIALHDAAAVVAGLAGADDDRRAALAGYPDAVAAIGGWRARLALQGMDDLGAVLATGLTALLSVHRAGGDAAPPARALWQEFLAAREGLLALCPEPAPEPRRIV